MTGGTIKSRIKNSYDVGEIQKAIIERSDNIGGCWIWNAGKISTGYGAIYFRGKVRLAHVVSWIVNKGEISGRTLLCHKCDVRDCVNPDHLFIGTWKDNSLDMVKKGRTCHGERASSAKLSEDDIKQIRALHDPQNPNGPSQNQIAEMFGVSKTTVSMIVRGLSWRHSFVRGHIRTRKLTREQISEIPRLYGRRGVGGMTQAQIAKRFGITQTYVSVIIKKQEAA